MQIFDRIVLGVGGVGSAALYHLARRGIRVVGLEQFGVSHDRGSSHGQSRIIRQAYFEHPSYVPLLLRAYELWDQLEAASQQRLFERVGLLEVGMPQGVVLAGIQHSAAAYQLTVEHPDERELRERFGAFTIPAGMQALFEPTAGILHVERCVTAHVRQAVDAGAALEVESRVRQITWHGDEVIVQTDRQAYRAGGLICCAGAWARDLLAGVYPLRVVRKHLHWFPTADIRLHLQAPCPAFFYELSHGCFYGFPQLDPLGVKVAEHSGGESVVDPSIVDRSPDPVDDVRIQAFLADCLPALDRRRAAHAVCMYTLTSDEHFLIDRHPQHRTLWFAAGLSGHGFKFAPVLGEILADLSLEGSTPRPIDFLRLPRAAET